MSVSSTDQGEARFSIAGDPGDSHPNGSAFRSYGDGFLRGNLLAWNRVLPDARGEVVITTNRLLGQGEARIQALWIGAEVDEIPFIVASPKSVSVQQGGSAQLQVSAVGLGDLEYQWFHESIPIDGANDSTLLVEEFGLHKKASVSTTKA